MEALTVDGLVGTDWLALSVGRLVRIDPWLHGLWPVASSLQAIVSRLWSMIYAIGYSALAIGSIAMGRCFGCMADIPMYLNSGLGYRLHVLCLAGCSLYGNDDDDDDDDDDDSNNTKIIVAIAMMVMMIMFCVWLWLPAYTLG